MTPKQQIALIDDVLAVLEKHGQVEMDKGTPFIFMWGDKTEDDAVNTLSNLEVQDRIGVLGDYMLYLMRKEYGDEAINKMVEEIKDAEQRAKR